MSMMIRAVDFGSRRTGLVVVWMVTRGLVPALLPSEPGRDMSMRPVDGSYVQCLMGSFPIRDGGGHSCADDVDDISAIAAVFEVLPNGGEFSIQSGRRQYNENCSETSQLSG